ncbi:MAG: hypothetical protein WAN11_00670 [Syntrophobacteraceae bacterium]
MICVLSFSTGIFSFITKRYNPALEISPTSKTPINRAPSGENTSMIRIL